MAAMTAKPKVDIKELRQRSDDAWTKRRLWNIVLDDVHRFCMPWLKQGTMPGHTDHLYDSTAVHSSIRFGNRLQNDVLPPGMRFWDLSAGPLIESEAERAGTNSALQRVSAMAHARLKSSNFEVASGEMCMALGQGTAAMLGQRRKDGRLGWMTVPIQEIALREGPFGDVEGVYWTRKWYASFLPRLFPNAKFPAALTAIINDANKARVEIEVRQDCEWDDDRRIWVMTAYTAHDDEPLQVVTYRKTRWITPRFLKMPGEVMGRGPTMLALPAAKTLNTTHELLLKSAALALFGVYLWRDDGVFDPDTAHNRPGAMWKVAYTGGPMGSPIVPLQAARNFDISQIVLSDQREQVRLALFDESLPDVQESVRSPTEILERQKRAYRDRAASTGRLMRELVTPVVELVIDDLEESGLLPTRIDIDQLGVELTLTSPLARAQALDDVQRIIEGAQLVKALAGEQMAQLFIENEKVVPYVLRNLGWMEDHIVAEAKRKQAMDAIGQMAGAQMGAEVAATAPPQPAAPPQLRVAA
jgi:hypothetical protein